MRGARVGIGTVLGAAALLAGGLTAGGAGAEGQSCREWREEHQQWKVEVVRRYLRAAPQRELDEALFDLLQREAYLTTCALPVQLGREELVGWRIVDRDADAFGSAVLESVLAQSGFDLELRNLFPGAAPPPRTAATPRPDRQP